MTRQVRGSSRAFACHHVGIAVLVQSAEAHHDDATPVPLSPLEVVEGVSHTLWAAWSTLCGPPSWLKYLT